MTDNNHDYTVAIVGSGFSGTLVATHLLADRSPQPLRVVLTERAASRFGRGVAYATNCFAHLLNVPAGKMSAFIEDQQHFLRWAERQSSSIQADHFVPRLMYGAYLNDVLDEAEVSASRGRQLQRVTDEVTSLDLLPRSEGALLQLHAGKPIHADRVVLALGNHPPADPPVANCDFYNN